MALTTHRGRIAETFYSIQGEGATAGLPAIFVRLQGCTVGCGWCDTKYSWDPAAGREVDLPGLLDEVAAFPCRRVVITGGEPLESALFPPLAAALAAREYVVEVETSGTRTPAPEADARIQWNVSLKLSGSGVPESTRVNAGRDPRLPGPRSLVEVRGERARGDRRGAPAGRALRAAP